MSKFMVNAGRQAWSRIGAGRWQRYALALIVQYAVLIALTYVNGRDGLIGEAVPFGFDFIAFWTASDMAREGALLSAFDPDAFHGAKQAVVPGAGYGFLWLYPPTFALLVLPLAFLPYGLAYTAWIAGGLAFLVAALRRLGRGGQESGTVLLAAFAFPGVYLAVFHGQNSLIAAGALAMAAHCLLRRRDVEAGAWIALLLIKPHLGLLIPVALIAARRWRAFASASAFSLGFLGVATAVFGTAYWQALFEHAHLPMMLLEDRDQPGAMISVFAGLRAATLGLGDGASLTIAYAGHWLVAGGLACAVAFAFFRDGVTRLTLAALIVASVTVSPYQFDYDLAVIAPALALGLAAGMRPAGAERRIATAAFVLPLGLTVVWNALGLSLGFAVPLIFLGMVLARLYPALAPGLPAVEADADRAQAAAPRA